MMMRMLLVAGLLVAADASACEVVRSTYAAELTRIRSCTVASECGQVLPLGCGCTRNPVARTDAKTVLLDFLRSLGGKLGCDIPSTGSTCDCPPADGFACVEGQCQWNLLPLPPLVPVPVPQPPVTHTCLGKAVCGGANGGRCEDGLSCIRDPDAQCSGADCPSCCVALPLRAFGWEDVEIDLFVLILAWGRKIYLPVVSYSNTVYDVKIMISHRVDIHVSRQKLIHRGSVLQETSTFAVLIIPRGSTLTLLIV